MGRCPHKTILLLIFIIILLLPWSTVHTSYAVFTTKVAVLQATLGWVSLYIFEPITHSYNKILCNEPRSGIMFYWEKIMHCRNWEYCTILLLETEITAYIRVPSGVWGEVFLKLSTSERYSSEWCSSEFALFQWVLFQWMLFQWVSAVPMSEHCSSEFFLFSCVFVFTFLRALIFQENLSKFQ